VNTGLPSNLNPRRFRLALSEYYHDKYERCHNFSYGRHSYSVNAYAPFAIYLMEGLNGEDLEERHTILPFLRIAEAIHSRTGSWPEIGVRWDDMCPGGSILIDLASLIDVRADAPLPELVKTLTNQIDAMLSRPHADFAKAEKHYAETLKGIAGFGEEMTAIQREFDSAPVCVVNTNTKARRLRYVGTIARLAADGTTSTRITNDLLGWASKHTEALLTYEDPKGAILFSTGQRSALPYVDLSRQLGILTPVGRGLALANNGRALVLLPTLDGFSLTAHERAFFLYQTLEHDRDFILPLILLLSEHPTSSKHTLRQEFPSAYRAHLIRLKEHCSNSRSRRQVDTALRRIDQWRGAERYMEHVVDPRVSWLVDMGFCSLVGNQIILNSIGGVIAKELTQVAKDNVFVITQRFLRQWYFKSLLRRTVPRDDSGQDKITEELEIAVIRRCCDVVRQHTTSLARNRVVASTLFRFASIVFFVDHSVTVDFIDLLRFCSKQERIAKLGWQLRWSTAQNDGYLTPINPL